MQANSSFSESQTLFCAAMPRFYIPCGPQATKLHFDDDVVLQPKTTREVNTAEEDNDLSKPTTGEYAGDTAKEFLKVLQEVADSIPVPGLGPAVKLATKLIEACDESHATLERAEELKRRIKMLITLLVDELKGKMKEEIQEKLKNDIEALEQDLTYIQTKLDEIASQHALLILFFQSVNKDRVDKCVRRLDHAMERFNLSREISQANLLDNLEKQIIDFYSNQQKTLDILRNDIGKVLAILSNRQAADSSFSTAQSRAALPANGDIFYGRDFLVDKLVHILTEAREEGQKCARICLLGPGGMGKTSTALAVMAHPEMGKCFPEHNQIWVPCVKAKSVSLLLDTLYSSLGTTRNSGDTLKDIISEIKSSTGPLILLLDNFETPWNIIESRSETERILYEIDKIVHVTLLITMRSSIPPCDGKEWKSFEIEAVDGDAARQIYVDIFPGANDDPKLPTLLQALGCMPLAITLMGRRAKITGLRAGKLLEEYERLGTAMLGRVQNGVDAKHSLDVCISLSVESLPMKQNPEAYELLASLAMLPVGTTYDALANWWVREIPDLMAALQVLAETSLIQRRDDHYSVLPVIRSYILAPSRFPDSIHTAMTRSACHFLMQHSSSPGDSSFKEHADALSAEEGNLQAILVDVKDPAPDLIKAYLILAKHQLLTRLRLEVIEHLLKLACQMKEELALIGDTLTCYGKILFYLDRYDDALEQFNLARQRFLSIHNEQEAALRLLDMVDIYYLSNSDASDKSLQLIMDAKSVFEKLNDSHGLALCVFHLGRFKCQGRDREEGIQLLTQAREMCKGLSDALYQAKCSDHLQLAYYWDRNYDAALEAGATVIEDYERLGQYYYLADSMQLLGRILFVKGNYVEALDILFRGLEICRAYGSPATTGDTLEMIGRIWAKMGRNTNAKGVYAEAMRYYYSCAPIDEVRVMRCQFLTGQADDPSLLPTPEERDTLVMWYNDF